MTNAELFRAIQNLADANAAWTATVGADDRVIDATLAAREALAQAPCETADELVEKLRALWTLEIELHGQPTFEHDFGGVAMALKDFFSRNPSAS